ncbi:1-acyl-sn-glycerol-3-phosphate acyltransferase [Virgibacillus sp. Bac330]|uniref:lysophospholipid acyltransferase family protein n=1 Tax=Virgibacillus sp. Bac330 TaxID=2419841 RepID=UPI000EF47E99|nr:lysophospholipid acyltransferase family protein [Virgibacillus sp. Bac330]
MIRTVGIYLYASILVLGTFFKLQRAKRLQHELTKEEIFIQPSLVSKKVFQRTGSTIKIEGQEKLPEGPALFVSNHQGLFDILVLLGYLGKPVGFIAKKEIKKLPIISSWMELIHCVFIDRKDRRQSVRAIGQGIEYLKEGHSIVIFPEGTRSRGRQLHSFKPGSFRLAIKANVPIVPVVIDGTYHMLEEQDGKVSPSSVRLTIKDAITPDKYMEMKSNELATHIEEIIKKQLEINALGQDKEKEENQLLSAE